MIDRWVENENPCSAVMRGCMHESSTGMEVDPKDETKASAPRLFPDRKMHTSKILLRLGDCSWELADRDFR